MAIETIFEIVCRALSSVGVDFLMIGGHAVNYYGYTRATMDVDFMIACGDVSGVRATMKEAGFTNVSQAENVVFFGRPDSPIRIDFLPVDGQTMKKLLSNSVPTDYLGVALRVPSLEDLVAMKIFALHNGSVKRLLRDSEDIVRLVLEHGWSLERQLKPLCLRYADEALYAKLVERIEGEKHA